MNLLQPLQRGFLLLICLHDVDFFVQWGGPSDAQSLIQLLTTTLRQTGERQDSDTDSYNMLIFSFIPKMPLFFQIVQKPF